MIIMMKAVSCLMGGIIKYNILDDGGCIPTHYESISSDDQY